MIFPTSSGPNYRFDLSRGLSLSLSLSLTLVLLPFALGLGIVGGWTLGGGLGSWELLGIGLIILVGFMLFWLSLKRRPEADRSFLFWTILIFLAVSFGFYRGVGARRAEDRSRQASAELVRAELARPEQARIGKGLTIVGVVVGEERKWRSGRRFAFRVERVSSGKESLTPEPATQSQSRLGQRTAGQSPRPKWEVFQEGPLAKGRPVELGDRLILKGDFSPAFSREEKGLKSSVKGDGLSNAGEALAVTGWTRAGISGGFFLRSQTREEGTTDVLTLLGKAPSNPILVFSSRLRRRLLRIGERTLTPQSADLLHRILLGEWILLPGKTDEGIRRAGVAHLFSVSGMHLLFWLSLFLGLGRLLRIPQRFLPFLSILVLIGFLLISGVRPPTLRAGIMYFLALIGRFQSRAGRRAIKGEHLLSAAACLSLLWRPLDLYSRSFWLSYGACVGIFYFYPAWKEALGRKGKHQLIQALLLSTTIQIVLAPFLINFFGGFSLLAPLGNLVLVPLAAVALQIGLLAGVSGICFFPAARLLNAANEVILVILRKLLQLFSFLPGYMQVESWPWTAVFCFFGALTIITWGLKRNPLTGRRRIPLFYLSLVVLLPCLVFLGWKLISPESSCLRMVVFNVGQGDAILLSTPDHRHVLIDGGTRQGFTTGVRPYLQANSISEIDLLVLTHPHEDHLGGVVSLLEEDEIRVGTVLASGYGHTTELYRTFLTLIKEKDLNLQRAVRGSVFRLGPEGTGLRGLVLHPPPHYLTGTRGDLNNNSVVLIIEYEKVRILLPGDLESEGKEELLAAYQGSLHSHILKVAHHGSRGAIHQGWLQRVRPEIAVISVGSGNYFGHPSPEVIMGLREYGTRVYRTDQHGEVIFEIKTGRRREAKVVVKRGNR